MANIVQIRGGTVEYGWCIYEWPRVMLEARFHAIWRRSDGTLVDVTPQEDGEGRILFLPDTNRMYSGQLTPSKYRPISKNRIIDELIEKSKSLVEMQMQYYVDDPQEGPGCWKMPDEEIPNFQRLKAQVAALQTQIATNMAPRPTEPDRAAEKPKRNDPCPCGLGKKYKKCCGTG